MCAMLKAISFEHDAVLSNDLWDVSFGFMYICRHTFLFEPSFPFLSCRHSRESGKPLSPTTNDITAKQQSTKLSTIGLT